MPLIKDRNTPERSGEYEVFPVAAATKVFAGSLAVLDAGVLKPGRTAVGLVAVGRVEHGADNSLGVAGAVGVKVKRGVFQFDNDAADPVAITNVGSQCFITDDHTVSATNGGNTKSVAGIVRGVDDGGVWVKI